MIKKLCKWICKFFVKHNTSNQITENVNQEYRNKVFKIQNTLKDLPQEERMKVTHHFSNGVYGRELFIPAGTIVVGEIHKHENMNVLSQGTLTVATEEGVKLLKAPYTVVSPPGTKRVGYAVTDCVWTCFHSVGEERDLEKIESQTIAKTYEELDESKDLIEKTRRVLECHGLL